MHEHTCQKATLLYYFFHFIFSTGLVLLKNSELLMSEHFTLDVMNLYNELMNYLNEITFPQYFKLLRCTGVYFFSGS